MGDYNVGPRGPTPYWFSTNFLSDSIGSIQNEMGDLQYQNANLEGLLRAAKRDNCTLHNQLFELKELLKLKTSTQ